MVLPAWQGCAINTRRIEPWEPRLQGNAVVLLGEVHDNPQHHHHRLQVLQRAVATGWRPSVVMEQFDIDRQTDIDQARREQPGNVQHLITRAGGGHSGWDWALYRPVLALVLEANLSLVAANLPREQAGRLVRNGYAAVLGAKRAQALGLIDAAAAPDAALMGAQQREVDAGHCGALPVSVLPGMARAQLARDAVMAERLLSSSHATRGAVLLAGNGHVRRDIGVPRWLMASTAVLPQRLWVVGYVEEDKGIATEAEPVVPALYDATVKAPRVDRGDPCAMMFKPPSATAR